MPTTETKIWMALRQRIVTIPGAYPLDIGDPAFVAPTDANGPLPYVIATNIHNEPSRFTLGSDDPDDRMGILSLTLMYPVHMNKNREYLIERVGLIAAHFPKDYPMRFDGVMVRVETSPRVVDPYRDDAYWRIPVTVRWQSFS